MLVTRVDIADHRDRERDFRDRDRGRERDDRDRHGDRDMYGGDRGREDRFVAQLKYDKIIVYNSSNAVGRYLL